MNIIPSSKLATSFAFVLSVCLVAEGQAAIYISDSPGGRIARANNDGSSLDAAWIEGLDAPLRLAVDDDYIYWTRYLGGIGRARLDGTEVNQDFIVGMAARDIYVDATHVYWTDGQSQGIGRANKDGSEAYASFIPATIPTNLAALTGDDTYLYWGASSSENNGVQRAKKDGSEVTFLFATAPYYADSLALSDTHVYWANIGEQKMGRAALDGSSVNQDLTPLSAGIMSVWADATWLYWARYDTRDIVRAKLDDSELDEAFLELGFVPRDITSDDVVFTDPAAACPTSPEPGCADFGGVEHKAKLSCKRGSSPSTKIKLTRGDVAATDLGNPMIADGTDFRVCIYIDGVLVEEASADAGDAGFTLKQEQQVTYKDKANAAHLTGLKLKVGAGKGSVAISTNLVPDLPITVTSDITVDLRSTRGCFTEVWSADQVTASDENKLSAQKQGQD